MLVDRTHDSRIIQVTLGNHPDRAAEFAGCAVQPAGELFEEWSRRTIGERVDRARIGVGHAGMLDMHADLVRWRDMDLPSRPVPVDGAGGPLLRRAETLAGGAPILAEPVAAEQLALRGDRIWIGNPIDAFSRRDQLLYLDWLRAQTSLPAGSLADIFLALT